jgi:long-chain acyl-CoA synthetase
MTLDEIVRRNALRFPRKTALAMGDLQLTWAQLDNRVDRLAGAFAAAGLAAGDRIAVLLGNCPEYLELYFACARSGVIAVPLNYRLTPREIVQVLERAAPAALAFGGDYAAAVDAVCGSLPRPITTWRIDGAASTELPGTHDREASYEVALAAARDTPRASPARDTDTLAVFFTSGTTGLPKGAMVSHVNLEANGYNQCIADGSRPDDVNLLATPLYHMGAVFMAVTYMMLGCTQVILPQFTPVAWLAALQRHRASVSLLISTMINSVLNEPKLPEFDRSSLRLIFYGGGPMPRAVLERAIAEFRCGFTQGYGLTETLEATFLVAADHVVDGTEVQRRRLASAGREAVGAEVRIVDDAGRDLPSGEVGEVLIRSRSVIDGYWRQPEETAQAIRGGWFHTGDLGFLDEDRYLYIVDRKKDMVISGGVNIYTKEIESVLYAHPAVREAAVLGLPDDQWGEAVTAAVSLREGMHVSADELIAHCGVELAGFKKPKRVVFLPELPKNPSGKILKREIKRSLLEALAR